MKRLVRIAGCLSAIAVTSIAHTVAAQEMTIGAYGSLDYQASHVVANGGSSSATTNGILIPVLDLFLRGAAGKWSFLSEVLLDVDAGNTLSVDIDRMEVSYEFGDWLTITAGRLQTALGYYNTAYPLGGLIYLVPIDRPVMVDQHDGASILPISTVGFSFRGRLPILQKRFTYDLDISNGRGVRADDIAIGGDANNSKALNLRLRYEIKDIVIGGNALVDWIPPRMDPAAPQPDTLREQIFGGHVAYVEHPWHLIAEGYLIQHIGPARVQDTIAGIAEFGYTVGLVTPYARYELARFPSDKDVFWAATSQQARGNYDAVSTGVKIIANENFAVKFELEVNRAQANTDYRAATQVAFGF